MSTGSLQLSNLSDQEIRSIIRRRILIEEIRNSKVQKLMIEQVSGTSTGLSLSSFGPLVTVLSSIPYVDDATMSELLPWLVGTAEAVLVVGAGHLAVTMMPGGFLLKAYALAKVGFYAYGIHKFIIEPWVGKMKGDVDPEVLFLNSNKNPTKAFVDGFSTDVLSKNIKLPELPTNFEAINGLTPGTSKRSDYDAALSSARELQNVNVVDFLGIPLNKFTPNTRSSRTAVFRDAFNARGTDESLYRSIAQAMVAEAISSNDPHKVIDILGREFASNNLVLHDLHHIDEAFGQELYNNSRVVWSAGRGYFGGNDFRITKSQFLAAALNDPNQSCIYYACLNFDTFTGGIPGSGMLGYNPTEDTINDLIRSSINPASVRDDQKKFAKLMIGKSDFLDKIRPYVSGDISRIDSAVVDGGDRIFINAEFFDNLKATIFDRLEEYWDMLKSWLTTAWTWLSTQLGAAAVALDRFYTSFIQPTLAAAWSAISSGNFLDAIISAFGAMWNGLVDFISNLFNSAGGGGSGGGSGGRSASTASNRASGPDTSVRRMQNLMNRYVEREDLGIATTELDGIWGNDTTRLFDSVIGIAFTQGPFKDDPDASEISQGGILWPDLANMLSDSNGSRYSEYTPDNEGAFTLIKDIYFDKKGKLESERGKTRTTIEKGEEKKRDDRGSRGDGGRLERNNIGIEVLAGNNNYDELEQIGFDEGTSKNVSDAVLTSIRSMNHTGGMVTLKVTYAAKTLARYDKGEVISIKKEETQSTMRLINYKSLRKTMMKVLGSNNSRVDTSKIDRRQRGRKGSFTLVLRIPPGAKRF